jgi:hypothetical protein
MKDHLLHIFRNSPVGRENLMQSACFCEQQVGLSLAVYIPTTPQFVLPFATHSLVIELDASYLQHPSTAQQHMIEVLDGFNTRYSPFVPDEFGMGNAPVLPTDWTLMTCPRVISEASSRIGLGHIGPKVRSLVKHATFPVFIPSMAFKRWTSVTTCFGGSELGAQAIKEGMALARLAGVPFTVHTQLIGTTREECEQVLAKAGMLEHLSGADMQWRVFEEGSLEENLHAVPHDSLVVVGAAGQRLMKELIFGSKLEVIQSTLPNPLVVIGPHCRTPWDSLPGGG